MWDSALGSLALRAGSWEQAPETFVKRTLLFITGRIWHKAFLRWVRSQNKAHMRSALLITPSAPQATGNKPPEEGKARGDGPLRPEDHSSAEPHPAEPPRVKTVYRMQLEEKVRKTNSVVFANVSNQTRLDTRSKARRPIKVRIKGRGRERAETRTLLVYVTHQLTWCNVSLMSQAVSRNQTWVRARIPGYGLN